MNIDDLTLGQVRQLQGVLGGAPRTATAPTGRAVIVADRGWIFAGDLSVTSDGYLRLERAVHVFRWEGIGFAKAVSDWKSSKVDIRPVPEGVELPMDSVIFRVPVGADWGIK